MNTAQHADLANRRHLQRNAQEDYAFLVSRGTSHANALARIGYTEDEWKDLRDADAMRASRAAARGAAA